jgi:hypothetical protein
MAAPAIADHMGGQERMDALPLVPVEGIFAVCKLSHDVPLPAWAAGSSFLSVTRTADELSVVCSQGAVPDGVQCDRGWRCLRVSGTLDLSLVGVLASMVGPLSDAAISVFVLSTFDTDYLLLKERDFGRAVEVLLRHGHSISPSATSLCVTSS